VLPTFQWTTFDVNGMLPPGWRRETVAAAAEADFRDFARTPVISREAPDVRHIARGRVHAGQVRHGLPWLPKLYRSGFLKLAQRAAGTAVAAAHDERYGVVLNVQWGSTMRFECHVDSNPLTGLLFCSDHALGAGGELVIAHDHDAASMAEIDRSCSVLRPQSGHLVFFDGRRHPHYVRPLAAASDIRITAVMNYYTASSPESTRPRQLNRHLYGDQE
jgi:2OG-Fe(II) oxygenase superfamily